MTLFKKKQYQKTFFRREQEIWDSEHLEYTN